MRLVLAVILGFSIFLLTGCDPDPGRIRLRYPLDFEYVTTYLSDEHQWGYWEVQQVEIMDEFILLASPEISIVNIKDPSSPYLVGSYTNSWESVDDMFVQEGLVFLTSKERGLEIIDISQADQPTRIGSFTLKSDEDTSVVAVGDYVYYYFPYGFFPNQKPHGYILNIINLPEISVVLDTTDIGEPMAVAGGYIYTAIYRLKEDKKEAFLQIVELSDSGIPIILSELSLGNVGVFDMTVAQEKAIVSVGSGIRIIDVADPRSPKLFEGDVYSMGSIGSFANIAVENDILIGDFIFSLQITANQNVVEVEPLARLDQDKFKDLLCDEELFPVYQSEFISDDMPCPNSVLRLGVNDVALKDGYVYVATEQTGLMIFRLPDPVQQ